MNKTNQDLEKQIEELLERIEKQFGLKGNWFSKGYWPHQIVQLIEEREKKLLANIETEVRRLGDTSDYPEWKGAAGINVGLIPKEKVIAYLAKLAGLQGQENEKTKI